MRVSATGETTSLADRKRRAGQRLVVGFDGLAVGDDLRALAREVRPAGFILFGRNVAEPAQVLDLTRELRDLVDPAFPALILVDQEGGRVQRIREPATVWPCAEEVAASGRTREVMRALGTELRALGVDVDLAPVADVRRSDAHPVVGDRAYGTSESLVARCVADAVRGLEEAHVRACLKHFPGHGAALEDSHEALPIVERDRPELKAVDLPPFMAGIAAGAQAVLAAHVVYPAWDEQLPASMSPAILGPLRARFDGLVLSDDIEMGAVARRWSVAEIVHHMAHADVDLVLCCHRPEVQHAAFEQLVRDQEDDRALHRAAEDSARRLLAFREQTFLGVPPRPGLDVVGCPAHLALRDEVMVRARGRV